MTVGELKSRMTSDELTHWKAFYAMEQKAIEKARKK